jgi:hypothetical protein
MCICIISSSELTGKWEFFLCVFCFLVDSNDSGDIDDESEIVDWFRQNQRA